MVQFLDASIAEHPLFSFTSYANFSTEFIPALWNNSFRLKRIKRVEGRGGRLATFIYPTAYISPKAFITSRTVVLPNAVINTDVLCGCIINLGAIVDPGYVIEKGCHISLGAIVKNANKVKGFIKDKS